MKSNKNKESSLKDGKKPTNVGKLTKPKPKNESFGINQNSLVAYLIKLLQK